MTKQKLHSRFIIMIWTKNKNNKKTPLPAKFFSLSPPLIPTFIIFLFLHVRLTFGHLCKKEYILCSSLKFSWILDSFLILPLNSTFVYIINPSIQNINIYIYNEFHNPSTGNEFKLSVWEIVSGLPFWCDICCLLRMERSESYIFTAGKYNCTSWLGIFIHGNQNSYISSYYAHSFKFICYTLDLAGYLFKWFNCLECCLSSC